MDVTRLFLLRHGQVEGHEQLRYNGHADVALTELGRCQAAWAKERLSAELLAGVYCSDLSRCRYTAELLAVDHGLSLDAQPALRELHIGDWEGVPWEELQRRYPEAWQQRLRDLVYFRIPGGESFQDAADRVRPALQKILAAHPGQEVALVGHGGINRIILLDAIGASLDRAFSLEQDYGCLNIVDYRSDGSCRVRLVNSPAACDSA